MKGSPEMPKQRHKKTLLRPGKGFCKTKNSTRRVSPSSASLPSYERKAGAQMTERKNEVISAPASASPENLAYRMDDFGRQFFEASGVTISSKSSVLKKNRHRINHRTSYDSYDIAVIPENDAILANWLAEKLGAPKYSSKWQRWLNLFGRDFLIKGIKRLIKYQKRHEEDVKNKVPGAKLIENPGGYLNFILQSMEQERERER